MAVVIALAGCGAGRQRVVSRRPGVLVAHTAGACRPTALTQIDNPSVCRVQLVARNDAGEAIGATGWIAAGTSRPRFDLPHQFDWVVLEVDPGCASPVASVRYAAAASACEASDESRR